MKKLSLSLDVATVTIYSGESSPYRGVRLSETVAQRESAKRGGRLAEEGVPTREVPADGQGEIVIDDSKVFQDGTELVDPVYIPARDTTDGRWVFPHGTVIEDGGWIIHPDGTAETIEPFDHPSVLGASRVIYFGYGRWQMWYDDGERVTLLFPSSGIR